jgi:hypothetical protein
VSAGFRGASPKNYFKLKIIFVQAASGA